MTTSTTAPRRTSTTVLTTGLMLFALFFGSGNLIFPPVVGASAGSHFLPVLLGFLATSVLLPLTAIVAVSTSGEGILGLARRVGPRFGVVMPLAVYLSIGPLYVAPRVTTVSYELATRPVLELLGLTPGRPALFVHAVVFLGVTVLVALRPSRIANRVGRWLTPALLLLLAVLCVATVTGSSPVDRAATGAYASAPLTTGLTQGYLTMDVLAASVFGIVVIQALRDQGLHGTRQVARATVSSGLIAAVLLAVVYVGLAMIGQRTGGDVTDGAGLLRAAASANLGTLGTLLFAAIAVLACLTTSVGLLSSWSGYAVTVVPRLPFDRHLLVSALVSLVLANLGLSEIIVVLSPVIVILYPVAMTLVVATLIDVAAPGHLRAAYLWPVAVSTVLAVLSALPSLGEERVSALLARTGLWNDSTGWILPTLLALAVGLVVDVGTGRWSTPAPDASGVQEEVEHVIASLS